MFSVVLDTFTTPKSKGGMKEESLDVLAAVVDMTTEVALTRPWRRWVEAGVARGEVCLKEKGAIMGMVLSDPMPPKIGLKVGVKMLKVVDVAVVIEVLEYKEPPISLLGGSPKMGFDVGFAEAMAGGGDAGRWGAGLLIPDRVLCTMSSAELRAGSPGGMVVLSA